MLFSELSRKAGFVALSFAMGLSASVGWTASQEPPSGTFKLSAASLLPSFLQVEAHFTGCTPKEQNGFAFIVGESDDKIFLAVPDHVIRCTLLKPPVADTVQLGGYSSDGKSFVFGQADVMLPAANSEDIAFLSVPKPAGWTTQHALMASADEMASGTPMTFLGYLQRPIIPQQLGVVVDACDTAITVKACGVLIDGLPTRPGTSGAIVFNEQGRVVGLNILAERNDGTLALRLDEIRAIAEKTGVPWNVFTDAEELQLGERLGRAINGGDWNTVETILRQRINLDRKYVFEDGSGPYPPLAVAGWAKQIDMAVILIKAGARAHYGPAIFAAMEAKRYDALKIMVDAGMGTPCPFNAALGNKDETSIKMMLDAKSPELVNGDCEGLTPLNAAIRAGNKTVADALLQLGTQGRDGKSLVSAILNGQSSMVDQLLTAGADLGLYGDGVTDSPLHAAAFVGNSKLVQRLLAMGVPVDLRMEDGLLYGPTPFEAAIFGGRFDVARLLVQHGASPLGYRSGKERIFDNLIQYNLTDDQQQQAKNLVMELAKEYCARLSASQFSADRDFRIQERNCGDL